jgi:hypothetical protein
LVRVDELCLKGLLDELEVVGSSSCELGEHEVVRIETPRDGGLVPFPRWQNESNQTLLPSSGSDCGFGGRRRVRNTRTSREIASRRRSRRRSPLPVPARCEGRRRLRLTEAATREHQGAARAQPGFRSRRARRSRCRRRRG